MSTPCSTNGMNPSPLTTTKRTCALTMARNDEFFLHRWVAYYGNQLGMENLYVFLDGTDQQLLTPLPAAVHLTAVPHLEGDVHTADRRRIDFLSAEAARLFANGYDLVIGTDVDEFLVVDPELHLTLPAYLSRQPVATSLSALGIDVGQHLQAEAPLRDALPFLSQRRYALLSDRYSKASVLARPVRWGSGFHRVRRHNFHIADGLYLFHFGCVDYDRLRARFADDERIADGWEAHLRRRARTIHIITHATPRGWEQTTRRARRLQQIFRQPYAWNKPTMLRQKWVVEIPERFRSLV